MSFIRQLHEIDRDDLPLVGGKALSLGLLIRAGLPVPPGFCLTTAADSIQLEMVRRELLAAFYRLGGGKLAVRSSAIAEDGAAASFAGQQDTILGVEGFSSMIQAVERCWASLHSERAQAYRTQQAADDKQAAMAIVVQRLVDAQSAGVLFTRNPLDVAGQTMLVEASWGLGESVVSGRVTPDRYHVERATGELRDQQLGSKTVRCTATGLEDVPKDLQRASSLDETQLRALTAIGRRVEEFFGEPRDIEWAWAEGQFWVLQARPITTAGAFERETVRREEIAALRAKAGPGGTVWARYNLAEILPAPTPMTWAVVSRFMSGRGGYGRMYRALGYDPDPIIDREGFIDLVCGRPYVNLSREPKLYFRDFPYVHDFAALKANPEKALYPQPTVDPAGRTARFWRRLPAIVYYMLRVQRRAKRLGRSCARRLRESLFPTFAAEVAAEMKTVLADVASSELISRFEEWTARTLDNFASQSLQPTVFAALTLANIERTLGSGESAAVVGNLVGNARIDEDYDLGHALALLSRGELSRETFLARFGHRGPNEMELAEPRWSETPERLPRAASAGSGDPSSASPSPKPPSGEGQAIVADNWFPAADHRSLQEQVARAQDFVALREAAKHHLMLGYAVMRRILVELDRRYALGGGIFYLTPEELPQLIAGEPMEDRIRRRRERRSLALSLEVPQVLFSDDLEAIGRPLPVVGGAELQGTPISAGVVEGLALVCEDPSADIAVDDGFILVCPSTDPAWVPLFLRARGLVMETGGILSHGAIVAREFHLPAVAGIANVQRIIHTGQRVRVDGNTGRVHVFSTPNGS